MTNDPVSWLYGLQSHGVKLGLDGIRSLLAPARSSRARFSVGARRRHEREGLGLRDAGRDARRRRSTLGPVHIAASRASERADPDRRATTSATRELNRTLDSGSRCVRARISRGACSQRTRRSLRSMTAAALCAFREAQVETAVLEVGLGGRFDATNAAEPLVSAIVTVDLDHVGTLGATLAAIAREKAGIAREGRPLVSGVRQPDAVAVIRRHCEAIGAPIRRRGLRTAPAGVRLALDGTHQRDNARVAVAAFEEFARAIGMSLDPRAIRRGLETARWHGRLQLVPGSPSILLDGAHNAAGAEALGASSGAYAGDPSPFCCSRAMADKDIPGILAPLAPHVASVVATQRPVLTRGRDARRRRRGTGARASRRLRSATPAPLSRRPARSRDPVGSFSSPARSISSAPCSPRSKEQARPGRCRCDGLLRPVLTMSGCRCGCASTSPLEARSRQPPSPGSIGAGCSAGTVASRSRSASERDASCSPPQQPSLRSFISAIEWSNEYLRLAETRAERSGLENVRFVRVDAGELVRRAIPETSVAAYYVFYPDPWPKKRHHKRRFLQPANLDAMARTLIPGRMAPRRHRSRRVLECDRAAPRRSSRLHA